MLQTLPWFAIGLACGLALGFWPSVGAAAICAAMAVWLVSRR